MYDYCKNEETQKISVQGGRVIMKVDGRREKEGRGVVKKKTKTNKKSINQKKKTTIKEQTKNEQRKKTENLQTHEK